MVRKLLLAVIIWMVSASPVWAKNWVKVGTTQRGDVFFVDTDSIRKGKETSNRINRKGIKIKTGKTTNAVRRRRKNKIKKGN